MATLVEVAVLVFWIIDFSFLWKYSKYIGKIKELETINNKSQFVCDEKIMNTFFT